MERRRNMLNGHYSSSTKHKSGHVTIKTEQTETQQLPHYIIFTLKIKTKQKTTPTK